MNNILRVFGLLLVFNFSYSQLSNTLPTSIVDNNYLIGKHFSYYFDADNQENIASIRGKEFIKSNNKILNLGFHTETVWIKFEVKNDSNTIFDKRLQIQKSLQDSIVFFAPNKYRFETYLSGVKIKPKDKIINGNAIYFPIKLKPYEIKTFYLRIKSKYGIALASRIIDTNEYLHYRLNEMLIIALIIGALISIAIYNFVIGFGFKDHTYYYYAGMIIASVLIQATVRGFFFNYFPIQNDFFLEWWPPFIIGTGVILFCIFSLKFLQPTKYNVYADYILKSLIYFTLIGFLIEIIGFEVFGIYFTNKLVAIATMIVGFAALTSGVIVYRNGNKFARYFILAWFFYSFSIVVYVGTLLAILPINWFTANAYMIGSFLEVAFLSLALVERYRSILKEKDVFTAVLQSKDREIDNRDQEIAKLLTESLSNIETKTKITEQLKEISKTKNTVDLRSVIADLNVEKLDDDKKLVYKQNLEIVNEKFILNLKTLYPKLTETDVEMATFARINLSIKEMAKLRNTSIDAIKKNRYRLSKKINLPANESLESFMSKF